MEGKGFESAKLVWKREMSEKLHNDDEDDFRRSKRKKSRMRLKLKRKEDADIVEEETDGKATIDAGGMNSEMPADSQQGSDKNRAIVECNTQDIAGN